MPARKLSYRDTILQFAPDFFILGTYRDSVSRLPDETGPGAGEFFGPTSGAAAGLGVPLFPNSGTSATPAGFAGPALPHIGRGIGLTGSETLTGSDVDVVSNKCTLMAWVSWAVNGAVAQNGKAVCKHAVAPMPPCLANFDGFPLYEMGINGVYEAASSPRAFRANEGRMLAITYDGARFKSWDDNVIVSDQAKVGNVATNALVWRIGSLFGPANFWLGSVSHVAFWSDRALSDDVMRYLFECGKVRNRSKNPPDEDTIAAQLTAAVEQLKEGSEAMSAEDLDAFNAAGVAVAEAEEIRAQEREAEEERTRQTIEAMQADPEAYGYTAGQLDSAYQEAPQQEEADIPEVISYEDYFG